MKVFIITSKVHALQKSIMPVSSKAYVNCYTSGNDYEEAIKKVFEKFLIDGIHPDEILNPICEMPLEDWTIHIKEKYGDLAQRMLSQKDFETRILSNEVVYGGFACFD